MSMRYIGAVISATANKPSLTSASGLWTMKQQMQAIAGNTWQSTYDPYFENTTLLLPGNGTNGAQNNTFLDSSTNNFTITRNGNTTQGTFSPFSQTGWSNYFDGTGDYLSIADNASLELGSSDFCIEAWVYPTVDGVFNVITSKRANGSSIGTFIIASSSGSYLFYASSNGSSWNVFNGSSFGSLTLNQWQHIAVYRSGNAWYGSINGVVTTLAASTSATLVNNSNAVLIGADSDNYGWNGYISNYRLVIGSAVYTSANFTPSTTPLTAITNTSLLTCQSNRFVDNSSNAFAITRNGDVSVQAFSPFNPTAAWSASTNGGSGYFDGTGDYLTAPDNAAWDFGTSDFTIETWLYPTTSGTQRVIGSAFSSSGNLGWSFEFTSGNLITFYAQGNFRVTSSVAVLANTWTHVAVSRSGTSLRLFINGVIDGSVTDSTNITGSTGTMTVAATPSGTAPFTGYQSNFRIVTGSAVYTAAFTTPTAPLTAITNTQLLCNFTNAGITDATAKNDLETVGNAQISTTQSKFGGSSMYFDGTGDYLKTPNNPSFDCGTGNFTIEAWVYPTASAFVVAGQFGTLTTGVGSWLFYINASNYVEFYYDGQSYSSNLTASTIPLNSWSHIAIVRNGSTITGYLNGSSLGSFTYAGKFGGYAWPLEIGATTRSNGNIFSTGFIDDLRITKGVARYTANFTAPTKAFPTQ